MPVRSAKAAHAAEVAVGTVFPALPFKNKTIGLIRNGGYSADGALRRKFRGQSGKAGL